MVSAEMIETAPWVASRYNFHVPVEGGALLYNANTGAVLHLRGADAAGFAQQLSGETIEVDGELLAAEVLEQMREGGFLIASGTDELLAIRRRFAAARGETPLVLTLTTTMDCNLGCFYCYEERSAHQLTVTDLPAIVEETRARLRDHPRKSLHVDWYGGEPLLNVAFLESASLALQAMCAAEGASFQASVISNGTVWPDDVESFIARHRIRQVQVSFDGLRENHNQRRRFRRGRAKPGEESSFDLIVALVDRLLDCVRVDLRFNADQRNQADLLPFVEFARERGWFARRFPAVVQPARLAAYSDRSDFLRSAGMSAAEFEELRAAVRTAAGTSIRVEESEVPDAFPYPKTSVCAALASRSEVIGADGLRYRCGLQVGEAHRAVGTLRPERTRQTFADADWWTAFDPTVLPSCSRCSFLPICWGGCPKKHLEADQQALDEQSVYWRTNLPRLVASRFGLTPPAGFAYDENDQFR
jgi:uncharacterized protein